MGGINLGRWIFMHREEKAVLKLRKKLVVVPEFVQDNSGESMHALSGLIEW
jgi:hypothetical protein